ncbi:unnamed protein product, partial [Candidula unifasciata]
LTHSTLANTEEICSRPPKHNISINNKEDTEDEEPYAHAISNRAQQVLSVPSVTIKYNQKVGANLYKPDTNPQGFVDLGLAENKLVWDLLSDK